MCCVAPADAQTLKTTCRPPTDCVSSSAMFGCEHNYTVMSGDTCYSISEMTVQSVDSILALNPAVDSDCTNLYLDQVLCLLPLTPSLEPTLAPSDEPTIALSVEPTPSSTLTSTVTGVPDWSTCHPSRDTCSSYGSVCCIAQGDDGYSGKHTCRQSASGIKLI